MKSLLTKILYTVCLLALISGLKVSAQQIGPILQSDDPKIEYKLVKNASGCYEVYFRTSVAFNSQLIQSAQVTLVAPKGAINFTNVPNANVVGNGVTFASTFFGNKYEIQTPAGALAGTHEYLLFGITPFSVTTPANQDHLLFSFCLTTEDCPGELRLINGVSPFSPYLPENGCTRCTFYTGSTDPAQSNLDPYNNMSIDNNVGQGPGSFPNTIEGYQANYGPASIPCDVPNLTSSISPTPQNGTVGTASTFNVTVGNNGTAPTTGNVTTTVAIPANTTVTSAGGNGWTCTPATPVNGAANLSCVITDPNIAVGASSSFPVNLRPNAEGTYTINATPSGGGDSNTSDAGSSGTLNASQNCTISAGTLTKN